MWRLNGAKRPSVVQSKRVRTPGLPHLWIPSSAVRFKYDFLRALRNARRSRRHVENRAIRTWQCPADLWRSWRQKKTKQSDPLGKGAAFFFLHFSVAFFHALSPRKPGEHLFHGANRRRTPEHAMLYPCREQYRGTRRGDRSGDAGELVHDTTGNGAGITKTIKV